MNFVKRLCSCPLSIIKSLKNIFGVIFLFLSLLDSFHIFDFLCAKIINTYVPYIRFVETKKMIFLKASPTHVGHVKVNRPEK